MPGSATLFFNFSEYDEQVSDAEPNKTARNFSVENASQYLLTVSSVNVLRIVMTIQ